MFFCLQFTAYLEIQFSARVCVYNNKEICYLGFIPSAKSILPMILMIKSTIFSTDIRFDARKRVS